MIYSTGSGVGCIPEHQILDCYGRPEYHGDPRSRLVVVAVGFGCPGMFENRYRAICVSGHGGPGQAVLITEYASASVPSGRPPARAWASYRGRITAARSSWCATCE